MNIMATGGTTTVSSADPHELTGINDDLDFDSLMSFSFDYLEALNKKFITRKSLYFGFRVPIAISIDVDVAQMGPAEILEDFNMNCCCRIMAHHFVSNVSVANVAVSD